MITCPDLGSAPTNGQKVGASAAFGSVVSFTCNTGYYITGKTATDKTVALKCQTDRSWNDTKPACSRKCLFLDMQVFNEGHSFYERNEMLGSCGLFP